MPNPPTSPRVTVITATYNSSKTLKLALQSLLAQDFKDFEAWIIGDACTDDSENVVASFGDERLFWANLAHNIGSQSGPNNEGLRRARGEYIAYLGHDDLWFPWHLSGLVAHLERTQADLVHPLCAVLRPTGFSHVIGPPGKGRSYAEHFVFPSSWLHRREVVLAIGGWRDQKKLSTGVDVDVMRRLALAGNRMEFCQQLSLLKFPSASWGIYAWQGVAPQQEYLQKILNTTQEFHEQCLLEIATISARQYFFRPTLRAMLKDLVLRLRSEIVKFYGKERPPLRQYLHWKFQRQRRANRKKRGLA